MSLKDALVAILTDPGRNSLYSVSQLVVLLRRRGVELATHRHEAWEQVERARYDIEMELFYRKALKTAIHDVLLTTDKVLDNNDLLIILWSSCEDLCKAHVISWPLPDDREEALKLIAELRNEVEQC